MTLSIRGFGIFEKIMGFSENQRNIWSLKEISPKTSIPLKQCVFIVENWENT